MITYLLRFMAGLVTFHAAEPTRIGTRWHFADGRTLPVISGGDGPLSTLQEQANRLTELRTSLLALADAETLSEEDEARYAAELTEFDELKATHDTDWVRAAEYAQHDQAVRNFEAGQYENGDSIRDRGAPAFQREVDPYDESTIRSIGTFEAAKRAIDATSHIGADGKAEMERKLQASRTDPRAMRGMDEYLLVHNSDDYSRGFFKLLQGRGWDMSDGEKDAIRRAEDWAARTGYLDGLGEERGISLTAANGGALIPAHLDPTIILTNVGTNNPFRAISKVVNITSNVWNGVTSAGVTMAWSTEAGDSSDVAPTLGTKAITVHKAHGTVPVTIEAFEDINGLGEQIAELIRDGKDRLEGTAFTSGTGSGQPKGVVTALYGETSRWESHATHSAFTATDLVDAQNMLGARFQPNASWLGSINYHNRVRAFGTDYWGQTVDLSQSYSGSLLGKPAYEASDMSTALSNTTNPALVYGDFDNYVIVDRVGLAVEFVPHLFSTGNGLPNGRRGWYAYWRVGADVVNNTAFVLSVNPAITG